MLNRASNLISDATRHCSHDRGRLVPSRFLGTFLTIPDMALS
jgi:hypothetical protein